MAKDIMGYARQHVAPARYARQPYVTPQRRATIDPSALSGRKAATGAPLASRPIEGGPALPSPQEYNPIIDAESGEDPNAPRVETQQPIESRGGSARYMLQTGGPRLDLSFLVPERANPNYDPNKAIGGENVPYQESKGIGGFFRRMLGDESNRMNIEAQQAQGAEWRAEEKAAKQRAERKQDLEDEIALREKGPQRRFDIEQKRLADKAIQDEIERQNAIDLALLKEGNEDIFRDIDMARKEVAADQDRQLRERQVKVTEDLAKRPRYKTIQTEKGGATVIDEDTGKPIRTFHPPGVGNIKDPITGKDVIGMVPGRWEEYERPTMPKNLGGAQVDRATGATMGGRLPAEAAAAAEVAPSRNPIMPMSEDARPSARMVPTQEEESIDPYELQRTTPSMGTMVEPATAAARRRARYLSPNMPGWSLGQ
jgi:hypothetical protein